jgi:TonB family protein
MKRCGHLAAVFTVVSVLALPVVASAAPQDPDEARLRQAIEAAPRAAELRIDLALLWLIRSEKEEDAARELARARQLLLEAAASGVAEAAVRPRDTKGLPRAGVDVPHPQVLKQVQPVCPVEAVRAGITGYVVVDAVIDKSGKTRKARVAKSLPGLDEAALDAVRGWRFMPTLVNGAVTDVAASLALRFSFRRDVQPAELSELARFFAARGEHADAARAVERAEDALARETAMMSLAPAAPVEPGAVRVRGQIRPPLKTKDVRPEYPRWALEAKVEGYVLLDAKVGRDGRVVAARVLRSIPALDQAAIDAVLRWEFTPTLANGAPTETRMTVSVAFTLPKAVRGK